ncbi:MAG: SMP-30/gluconolactonase/LRE family protein [Gammaproteobacteria bacterium]|nr:SMP-30/gluconolactonase/LRE family protein [Gammaproteobacteria bacterium]
MAEDIALTNGLGFSPDGKTLYHSDSRRQTVNCYDVGEDGELGSKQEFVTFEHGVPDGLAVSEDGRVWVALAGGGHAVAVLDSNGKHVETIEIPLPMCTSVCFGGDEFTDLFITSGSDGAESDRAGAVFRYEAGVGGLRVPPARIKLGT